MNVLITGVAGLLGSQLANWLIKSQPNVRVYGIDNLTGGYATNIPKGVKFFQKNIGTDEIGYIFDTCSPDVVYHFAAYAAEGLSPFIRKFNYVNNVVATAEIVNQSIRTNVKRLVFTSSMAVYGHGAPPFDEKDPVSPIDPYGNAKLASETDIRIAGEQHALDWCIIRPHNVYGANQNIWDKYRNVLGIWMFQKLNNLPITIYGDGLQARAFSYIDDILKPLWLAGTDKKASKQIINLGGIQSTTLNQASRILSDITGGFEIEYLEPRFEVKHAYPTFQKSCDILSYVDTTDLASGLSSMWEWALKQPIREQKVWKSYEIDNGLYSYWKNLKKPHCDYLSA